MQTQVIGGRETGLSYTGLSSIRGFYVDPFIDPIYENSQYSGMPTPEDPFGGSVDILPDAEPEPLLKKPISEINFSSPIIQGIGLLVLLMLIK